MPYGYSGKVIFVNLSNQEINIKEIKDDVYKSVLGGEGLGALVLNENIPIKANPLGPENMIGFLPGLLTGCGVPASSRTVVVAKSPLTSGWGDANSGGVFAPEMKACGYDGIFIKGISKKPVYLFVTDKRVELKNASHLWGKGTVKTKEILIKEVGDSKIKVASIGPAGEKLSLISSIIMDGRAAARSGIGAVMGSKLLKAIVLRGKKKVSIANQGSLIKMNKDFTKYISKVDYFVIDTMRNLGSCGFVSLGIKSGIAPIQNWKRSGEKYFPHHNKFDGKNVIRYRNKKYGCFNCPIACGGIVNVKEGFYKVENTRLPEYETLIAFGSMVLNDNVEAVFKAQSICDDYGIDTISTGAAIAFAIECYENGILTSNDTDDLELKWGNTQAIISLTEKIAKREGFGNILADGVKRAAQKIKKGSEVYAMHIGGQELPFHDFRYETSSRGTMYISDPTPSRHERCTGGQLLQLNMALGPYQELQPEAVSKDDYRGMGRLYAKGSKYYEAFVSCGLCAYIMGATSKLPLVDMILNVTGWENFNVDDLLDAGERIQILRHFFNFREGLKLDQFDFPLRLKEKPLFEGALKGSDVNYDWKQLRKAYFEAYNLDPETGKPTKERMKELGLEHIYNMVK